jgi:hypothetical protein
VWEGDHFYITAASFFVLTSLVVINLLDPKRRYFRFVPGLLFIDLGAALVLWSRYVVGMIPGPYVKGGAIILGVLGIVLVEREYRQIKQARKTSCATGGQNE